MIRFKLKIRKLIVTVCFFTAAYSTATGQNSALFKKAAFITGNDTMQYRLLYPADYNRHKHYPLIVFLHGDGERGNDNEKQLFAMPKALTDSIGRIKYTCFILAPQCPKKRLWVKFPNFPESLVATPEPTLPAKWAFELLDSLIKQLPIDRRRIYITGYSGGGEGTLDFLNRRPDMFAAAIPLCSVSDTAKAYLIHHIPIWAFHGDRDDVNNVKYSRLIIAALKRYGGNPKYTEYPGIGHNIWWNAYKEPGLYDWLFSQRK